MEGILECKQHDTRRCICLFFLFLPRKDSKLNRNDMYERVRQMILWLAVGTVHKFGVTHCHVQFCVQFVLLLKKYSSPEHAAYESLASCY